MKRTALLCLSILLLAPPLDATSVQCLPSRGCPKDQSPPACCKPPPCEFFHELKVAKAMRHAASKKVQAFALALAEVDSDAGLVAYSRAFRADMMKAHARFANCPPNHFYRPPPLVMAKAAQQCRIMTLGDDSREISLEEMKANSDSCNEIVAAEYARTTMQKIHCEANAAKTERPTVQERRWQDLTQAQSQIDSLESSLLRYWGVCTITPDAKMARLVSKAGLDALMKARQEAKAKAKAAARAAKRS